MYALMYQLLSSPSEYPYHVDQGKKTPWIFLDFATLGI